MKGLPPFLTAIWWSVGGQVAICPKLGVKGHRTPLLGRCRRVPCGICACTGEMSRPGATRWHCPKQREAWQAVQGTAGRIIPPFCVPDVSWLSGRKPEIAQAGPFPMWRTRRVVPTSTSPGFSVSTSASACTPIVITCAWRWPCNAWTTGKAAWQRWPMTWATAIRVTWGLRSAAASAYRPRWPGWFSRAVRGCQAAANTAGF